MIRSKCLLAFVLLLVLSVQTKEFQTKAQEQYDLKRGAEKQFKWEDINTESVLAIAFVMDEVQSLGQKQFRGALHQPYAKLTTTRLVDGKPEQIVCQLTFSQDLCVIENPNQQIEPILSCQRETCKGVYIVYQTRIQVLDKQTMGLQDSRPNKIFSVPPSDYPRIIKVICNSPQFCDKQNNTLNNQFAMVHSNVTAIVMYKEESSQNSHTFGLPKSGGCVFVDVSSDLAQHIQVRLDDHQSSLEAQDEILEFVPMRENLIIALVHEQFEGYLNLELQIQSAELIQPQQQGTPNVNRSKYVLEILGDDEKTTGVDLLYQHIKIQQAISRLNLIVTEASFFKNLRVRISSEEVNMFIQLRFTDTKKHRIYPDQLVYFTTVKGKTLEFQAPIDKDVPEGDQIHLTLSDDALLEANQTLCSLSKGCNVTVTAKQNCHMCSVFLSQTGGLQFLGHKFTSIRQFYKANRIASSESKQYYVYEIPPLKTVLVTVHTEDALLYGVPEDEQDKCKDKVFRQCASILGSTREPIVVKNKKKSPMKLYLLVVNEASRPTIISVHFLGDKYIQIIDAYPFTQKINQNSPQMLFVLTQPATQLHDVNINLVAPLGSLFLEVYFSEEQLDNKKDGMKSLNGDLVVPKSNIQDGKIFIRVSRLFQQNISVGFSLIVSTQVKVVTLREGATHYENLKQYAAKHFTFNYNCLDQYTMNVYVFNHEAKDVRISFKFVSLGQSRLSNFEKGQRQYPIINKTTQTIGLMPILSQICKGYQNCQIGLSIVNQLQRQADVAITFYSKKSTIALNDGYWLAFPVIQAVEKIHFYYVPTVNSTVDLLFKSADPNVSFAASIFSLRSIRENGFFRDVNKWPYPETKKPDHYKPVWYQRFSQIPKCFPQCILLITVAGASKPIVDNYGQSEGQFKIMVSASAIQIPEKVPIDIFLEKDENKLFLVDLREIIRKDYLTFFINVPFGQVSFCAKLYSTEDPTPAMKDSCTFKFESSPQFQIPLKDIRKQITDQKLQNPEIYLSLLVVSETQSLIRIEYSSHEKDAIRMIHLDSYQTIKLSPQKGKTEQKTIQLIPIRNYKLKIIRARGYPYITIFKCLKNNIGECLQRGRVNKEAMQNTRQLSSEIILNKKLEKWEQLFNESFKVLDVHARDQIIQGNACSQCVVFIWVQADTQSEIAISLQSQNKELELNANEKYFDTIRMDQTNYYLLSLPVSVQVSMGVSVEMGKLIMRIYDDNGTSIRDEYSFSDHKKNQLFHLDIKPSSNFGKSQQGGLRKVHLSITGKDPTKDTKYSLYYSQNEQQRALHQDSVEDYRLSENGKMVFVHQAIDTSKPLYLSISSDDHEKLLSLNVTLLLFSQREDTEPAKQMTPEMPPRRENVFNQMTVNYAIPPGYGLARIQVSSAKQIDLKLNINTGDHIMLAHNYEMPLRILPGEQIKIISNSEFKKSFDVVIRKCDQTPIKIKHAFTIKDLQRKEFDKVSLKLGDNFLEIDENESNASLFIKIKNEGKNKFKASELSIKISENNPSLNYEQMEIEQNQKVNFQIINYNKILVTFPEAECTNCKQKVKYFVANSSNLQKLKTNLYCAHHYFRVLDEEQEKVEESRVQFIELTNLTCLEDSRQLQYAFNPDLLQYKDVYLAIKAVNPSTNEQQLYEILTIASLGSFLEHIAPAYLIMIALISILSFMLFVWLVRAQARKGYRPILLSDQFPGLARAEEQSSIQNSQS